MHFSILQFFCRAAFPLSGLYYIQGQADDHSQTLTRYLRLPCTLLHTRNQQHETRAWSPRIRWNWIDLCGEITRATSYILTHRTTLAAHPRESNTGLHQRFPYHLYSFRLSTLLDQLTPPHYSFLPCFCYLTEETFSCNGCRRYSGIRLHCPRWR